jgi:hypothetical protein
MMSSWSRKDFDYVPRINDDSKLDEVVIRSSKDLFIWSLKPDTMLDTLSKNKTDDSSLESRDQ